ncbi:hypothetical protein BO94DRAFT_453098 [Aspergillus sclerotioniger CBS 115572]|uniref:Actin-like ATPase domain-containing protein n=1 Tax=Aspergillus sclerotioniger CBS 115572 TaxID=1450535 RepID=A0A317XDP5_9EURO|nr:hypothetical protein BO94DRAFT_453098 [Aspergillus sclerotioniger CBS 115572]PWY96746.1 hypothetical protein BO94DRAFT_453098 [Aspergillus sclerotioniger CBS 115572]
MELDNWTPDIVVGVDFGMTCTGIAYSSAPDWSFPKPIQRWPGILGAELANKVPSQIRYVAGSEIVKSWGFLCENCLANDGDNGDIKEYFKLNLDPDFFDSRPDSPSREEAVGWFRDYIRCVYEYTLSHFAVSFPRFSSRQVEFVFSIPTTWKDPRMVAQLKESIELQSPNHRAIIGLTEAEAAAVYASAQLYQRGDVILVCDAGGGTMDVNVLKLVSSEGEPTKFVPLGFVEGKPIWSVLIDMNVHRVICDRLEQIRDILPGEPNDIAWDMMAGRRFERYKCGFGAPGMEPTGLMLEVPSLGRDSQFPKAGIIGGDMCISRDEIQQIFDERVRDTYELLDEQIGRLKITHPLEQISFLVLSGGFGSSPYLRAKLKERYSTPGVVPNIIEVLTVDEPQLAVVQGQVMNRIQELKQGAVPIQTLCSRVSYGVICDKVYDARQHTGEPVRYDERDKRTYAVKQIDWLILQGDPVPRTGVSKQFQRKVYPRDITEPWKAQIVMSTLPKQKLPHSMSHTGAKLVCNLEVDMTSVDKQPRNIHWYNRGPVYLLATFMVKIVVSPTDLRFELWNKDGERIHSRSRDSVKVKWEPFDLNKCEGVVPEIMDDEPRNRI